MKRNALSWVISAAALVACGGRQTAGSNADAGATVDLRNFSTTAAATFCHALQTCCSAKRIAYTDAPCVGQVTSFFENLAAPARTSTRIAFDAAAASACLDELRTGEAACKGDFDGQTGPIDPHSLHGSACYKVFAGTAKPGEPCDSADECAPDPDPNIKSIVVCENHACQRISNVHATGESCEVSEFEVKQCKNGTSCVASPTKTCPDFSPLGGSCKGVNLCDRSVAYCNDAAVCTALPGLGESCGEGGLCLYGLYCSDNTCKTSSAPAGASCSTPQNGCPLGQACSNGTCLVSFKDGISFPSHFHDVTPRSCTLGPFTQALDDGGLAQ